MHMLSSVHDTGSVLTLSGEVGAADVPELTDRLVDLVERSPGDVLLDMREVSAVDDLAMGALTAGRSRAKFRRLHIGVVCADDSVTAQTLRRHGMHFRFPMHPDLDSALAGLAADRAARDRLTVRAVPNENVPADTLPVETLSMDEPTSRPALAVAAPQIG